MCLKSWGIIQEESEKLEDRIPTNENAILEDEDWDGLIDLEDKVVEDDEAEEEEDTHEIWITCCG